MALVLGLGVGLALGRAGSPAAESDVQAEQAAKSSRRPRGSSTRGPCEPCPDEARVGEIEAAAEELRTELAAQRRYVENLEIEAYGIAPTWAEGVPPELSEEAFGEQVAKAIEACDPGVELVGVDCEEPPCLAVLRPLEEGWWDRLVNTCPEWTEAYGSNTSMQSGKVDCGETMEEYYLLGSYRSKEWTIEPDTEDTWNAVKRMNARAQTWVGSWDCEGE